MLSLPYTCARPCLSRTSALIDHTRTGRNRGGNLPVPTCLHLGGEKACRSPQRARVESR